jgi:hypothetical protein
MSSEKIGGVSQPNAILPDSIEAFGNAALDGCWVRELCPRETVGWADALPTSREYDRRKRGACRNGAKRPKDVMSRWRAAWVLLIFVLGTPALFAQEPVVVHPVVTRDGDASPLTGRETLSQLSFQAFGRDFVVALQDNDRIKGELSPTVQAGLAGIRLYRGEVLGYLGSWVRLTAHDDVISGVIFDGVELYRFHREAGRSTIQREVDTSTSADSLAGDIVRSATSDVVAAETRKPALTALKPSVGAGKTLAVGIVADSAYVARNLQRTNASLLETMNVVDGIFVWQLGVRISVAELQILDAANDPFVDATASAFLEALSTFKGSRPTLAPLGLVHLFTGRNVLGGSSELGLIGAARLGSVCDVTSGVGITKTRGMTSTDSRVAAHEIGHNFGAPHDNEVGSACATAEPGFLMAAFDTGASEFSPCSIDRMMAAVASGTCFVDWQPNDFAVRVIGGTSQTNLLTEPGFLSVAIDNVGVGVGNALELTIETTSSISLSRLAERSGTNRVGFKCERTNSHGRCTATYMPATSAASFDIEFFALAPDGGSITVSLGSGNDPNPSNDSLVFPVTVPPAVDLAASLRLEPGQARAGTDIFYPGDLVKVASTLRNLSSTTATNVVATFNFPQTHSHYAVEAPPGVECTVVFDLRFDCPIGDLPAGEQRDFVLTFRTPAAADVSGGRTSGTVRVAVAGQQHDPYRENNQASRGAQTTTAIFDLVLGASYPDVAEIGTPATFSVSLQNLGPDVARSVYLTVSANYLEGAFEILSVVSNLADCSRALLSAFPNCAGVASLASGETLTVTYEFVAKRPHAFFATPRFEYYSGYELGMNAAPPTIRIDAKAPTPTPPPVPQPAPTAPAAEAPGGGGGGGSVEILTLLILFLAQASRVTQRTSNAASKSARRLGSRGRRRAA